MSPFAQNLNSIVDIAKAVSVDPIELEKMPIPLTKKQGSTEPDKSISPLANFEIKVYGD